MLGAQFRAFHGGSVLHFHADINSLNVSLVHAAKDLNVALVAAMTDCGLPVMEEDFRLMFLVFYEAVAIFERSDKAASRFSAIQLARWSFSSRAIRKAYGWQRVYTFVSGTSHTFM